MREPPCVGRMCGCRTFSLVSGLPSRLSAVGCPPLFEPFIGTTPESDSWPACLWVVRLSPSPTGLPPHCAADADQVSRFSCMMFPDVRGVSDCAGSPVVFVFAPTFVWSSPFVIGSTPWSFSFTAQYPACPCPCLRFASSLSTDGARLGVRMGHYSFPVRLFHSRHHAGLSRRTTKPISGYSYRSASTRSSRAALLAGQIPKNSPTAAETTIPTRAAHMGTAAG